MKALTTAEISLVQGGESIDSIFDFFPTTLQEMIISSAVIGGTIGGVASGWGAYYYIAASGYSLTWKVALTLTGTYGGFVVGSLIGASVGYVYAKIVGMEEYCVLM